MADSMPLLLVPLMFIMEMRSFQWYFRIAAAVRIRK